jgi:glycosyltransferase involved in cell wall biosynthesis
MDWKNYLEISVVIPTYNRPSVIHETLERIFSQTRQPDDVIVVDDGSTGDTLSALANYGNRVRVIQITNSGDLVARNTGLRAARGDLVAFCDDDDLWQRDFISSMAMFWEKYTKPICAYANFQEINDGKFATRSKFETAPSGYWSRLEVIDGDHAQFTHPIIRDLIAFQPFFPSCMMVDRARFLALGGWDEGASRMVGCDFATALRIAEQPPIGVLRRPVVGIRKHAGNFSGNVQRMNLGDADVLSYVLSTRPELFDYAREIKQSIEDRRIAAFDTAFACGDFVAAKQITALLTTRKSGLRHRLKRTITKLPSPLRDPAWRVLTRRRKRVLLQRFRGEVVSDVPRELSRPGIDA